jgi:peptidoglycan-N-acetylglucosamine deacetylase
MDRDRFQWDPEPITEVKPGTTRPPMETRQAGSGAHGAASPAATGSATASPGPQAERGWRFTWLYLPVVLVAAALWLLLGPVGTIGQAWFVSHNGIPLAVSAGVSLAQARDAAGAGEARTGAQVDVAGDVRSLVGGGEAVAQVYDVTVAEDYELADGAQAFEYRGQDVAEKLVKSSTDIPFETVVSGSGSVVVIETQGRTGVSETYSGAYSKRVVAEVVTKEPVNTVLRKTGGGKAKLVALTFDDGPDKWTDAVLAALASRGVKATFFMLGGNASAMPAEVEKVRAAGHEIANHTWDHADLSKLSEAQIRSEIQRTDNILGETRYLRPPYGNYNKTVEAVVASMGKELVLWTVDTLDWQSHSADAIMTNLKNELRPGAIILMHDGGGDRSATVAAIPRVIDYLLAQGYGITTLAHLTGG